MIVLYFSFIQLLFKVHAFRDYLSDSGLRGHKTAHQYTASVEDVPYHVLIVYSNLFCSGSLIRSKVVVTAASCFAKWTSSQRVVVKVGANSITALGQVIEVLQVKPQEYFDFDDDMDNDIALLLLKDHVIFGANVKKLILLEPSMHLLAETILDVLGWGSSDLSAKYANRLLRSKMTLMNTDECKKHYPYLTTSSKFCVRYAPEYRLTDNGGPAVFKDLLVGVLSFGASNSRKPYVALVTNVSYFHGWITVNIKRLMTKVCVPPPEHSDCDWESNNEHDVMVI